MPNAIDGLLLREEICAIHFRLMCMCELVKDVAWKCWLVPKANKFHFLVRYPSVRKKSKKTRTNGHRIEFSTFYSLVFMFQTTLLQSYILCTYISALDRIQKLKRKWFDVVFIYINHAIVLWFHDFIC